jgi:hypothetical protein
MDGGGSVLLGTVIPVLDRWAICPRDREAGDGDWLAPQGLSAVLGLESPPRTTRTTAGF